MTVTIGRRKFLAAVGGAAVAWPLAVRAQQRTSPIRRIGIIDDGPLWDHFRQGLRELGYIEGQTVVIDYRSAEGKPDRLAAVASELARLPVDVIVTFGTAAALRSQGSNDNDSHRHDGWRSRAVGARDQSRPAGRKYHRLYSPRAGYRRQTAAASQRGLSDHLSRGFSLESKKRLPCRLPRRVEICGTGLGRENAFCRGFQLRRVR